MGYTGSAGSGAVANLDAQYSWSNTHTFAGNVSFIGNSSLLKVPVGTTAQRPANPPTGAIRFNTTTTDLEYSANSSTWYSITTQETLTSNNINITNTINIGNSTVNTVITSRSLTTNTANVKILYANTANVNVLYATGNVIISGNTAVFKVPVGTTAQRPTPADTGYIRFNTTTTDLEYSANSSTWYSITSQETLTSNNINITNTIKVGNGVVNTTITNNSITTASLNLTSNTGFSTFSTELNTVATAKTVTFGAVPLNSATANGYVVEFFVKFKTLPTSGISAFAGTTNSQLGLEANTSAMRVVNNGYAVAGDVVYRTFENDIWYHFAYIGRNANTYIAIDGQVTNLNNIGGYSGYTATGTWEGGWSRLSGNAVFSNFRVVAGTSGGNVYNINGFTVPTAPLTAISNTKILTLIGSTFVDASVTGTTVTTAGSPTLISDTVSISNMPGAITTTITGTTLSVSNIYTTFLYANNAAGSAGQSLAANSTGGIFWTNVIGYTGST